MKWVLKYWVAIVVAVVAIGAGVGSAVLSSSDNNEEDAGTVVDVLEKDIAEETPDLVTGSSPAMNARVAPGIIPTPLISLPNNLAPWGTGPSQQTPSTGGSLSNNQVPWGTGPSQQ